MPHPTIGQQLIILPVIDSTNNYAMAQATAGLASHGTAYFALQQTAGKGQRGKTWHTSIGENIMMSVVIQPESLITSQQFLLSAAIALGCYDFFKNYAGEETTIKWPNDIYWRDRKAAGILIESRVGRPATPSANDLWQERPATPAGDGASPPVTAPNAPGAGYSGPGEPPHVGTSSTLTGTGTRPAAADATTWLFAIAGIGMNINQTRFSPNALRPVSLKQITGRTFDLQTLARELCQALEKRYQALQDPQQLLADYRQALYKLDQAVKLKKDNYLFQTTITGVTPAGQLTTRDVVDRQFEVGEIEWVI